MLLTPVAQYLRVSTRGQAGNLASQAAVIATYAAKHGMEVVKTYQDVGVSGVSLRRRSGLQMLLRDVLEQHGDYRAILVHDVSRWGRFQNADESAHYEFLCLQAGVPVLYCTEESDGGSDLMANLMKSVRRAMAAEYSRELSTKCREGLRNLASRGYHVGGSAIFGFRRSVENARGLRKGILADGHWKVGQTNHTRLVLGPVRELRCVRRLFQLAIQKRNRAEIARKLNEEGFQWKNGSEWTAIRVDGVLRNQKYCGVAFWGRTTLPLQTRAVRVPKESWVEQPVGVPPLVSRSSFERARQATERWRKWNGEKEILASLRRLRQKHGFLHAKLIAAQKDGPSIPTIYRYFGSLRAVYQRLGIPDLPRLILTPYKGTTVRDRLINDLLCKLPNEISITSRARWNADKAYLQLPSGREIQVLICTQKQASSDVETWRLPLRSQLSRNKFAIVALWDKESDSFGAFYWITATGSATRHGYLLRANRCRDLAELCKAMVASPDA